MRIIYLEIDEEITSVIDKIKKTNEADIALIFPKRAAIFRSIVSLKLLKKQVELFSKEIILVIPEKISCNLARQVGFQIGALTADGKIKKEEKEVAAEKFFKETIEEEKRKEVLIPDDKITSVKEKLKGITLLPRLNLKIFIPFIILFIFFLGYFVIFVLPRAEIKIVPRTEMMSFEKEVVIDSNASDVNLEKNIIPGKVETKEIWAPKKKFEVKGEKEIGEKAKGEITVYNKYSSKAQVLPKESKFEAQRKVFLSLSDFEIPGAKIEGGKAIPGQVKIKVEAEKGGTEYNLKPSVFVITSMPLFQQKDIWAESQDLFSGGTSKKIKALQEEDLKRAKEELVKDGARQALEQIKKNLLPNQMIVEAAAVGEVMEVKSDTKIDQEATNFELEGKVRVKTMIFDKQLFEKAVFFDLEKKLTDDKFIVDKTLKDGVIFEVKNFDAALGKLILKIKGDKLAALKIDAEELKKQFLGLDKAQIEERFKDNSKVKSVFVSFWPAWVKKTPTNPNKVRIFLDTKEIRDTMK